MKTTGFCAGLPHLEVPGLPGYKRSTHFSLLFSLNEHLRNLLIVLDSLEGKC